LNSLLERLKTSRLLQVFLLLLLLAPLQYHFAGKLWQYQPLRSGDAIPAATLLTESGSEWTPAADSGRIVVLSFWASWCEPCRRELPLLDSLYGLLDSTEAVRFYAVNVGEPRAEVDDHVRRTGMKLPVLYDTAQAASEMFAITALPTLVVVGRDGTVLMAESGFQPWITSELRNLISHRVEDAFRPQEGSPSDLLDAATQGAPSGTADSLTLEFHR
jgi:thiol-disulfide isomerase/thioredoxin